MECVLFDNHKDDLKRIVGLVRKSPNAWRNPISLLAIILKECGLRSEEKRQDLDDHISEAEQQTESSPWKASKRDLSVNLTSRLAMHHSTLMFLSRAVKAEVSNWRFLKSIATDESIGPWLKAEASDAERHGLMDLIDFEISHTLSRETQIACLKERIDVQMTLINNLIAHKESSQTILIAVLALVFAPASLIAGIFSAGLFVTTNDSWIHYVATTIPVTLVTVAAGLSFLQKQWLRDIWRKPKERPDETPSGASRSDLEANHPGQIYAKETEQS